MSETKNKDEISSLVIKELREIGIKHKNERKTNKFQVMLKIKFGNQKKSKTFSNFIKFRIKMEFPKRFFTSHCTDLS